LQGFELKEKEFKSEVDKLSLELVDVNSLYNRLIGKLDVLESLGEKK